MLFSILALALGITPASWASDEWYGTITFGKTFMEESTEVFPAGHAYHPGQQLNYNRKTWSGTLRYIPGRKAIISAHYSAHRGWDRKTDRVHPCMQGGSAAYHDYELNDSRITVSPSREWPNSRMTIIIIDRNGDGGSYSSQSIASGGPHVRDANQMHVRREFYNGCDSKDPYDINDQRLTGSDGMESLSFNIRGNAKPDAQTVSGSWTGKDEDGGDLTYSWNFTRAEPNLIARITGTPSVQRVGTVNLSAASSIGNIAEYEWEFVPEGDCITTPEGATVKLAGPEVSFKALCDFTAHLTVRNANASDSASFRVSVTPRPDWRTTFQSRAGPHLTSRLVAEEMHLGANRCALHAGEAPNDHMIHSDAPNNSTWLDSGYTLEQVADGGPFQGAWYVKDEDLKVERLERVNASLLPGGELFILNQSKGNARDLTALANQVRSHEEAHSSLLREQLDHFGVEGDPAYQIESMVGIDQEMTQTLTDMKIREVEGALRDASSEDNVKARLRNAGLSREIHIWFPTLDGGEMDKNLGPLWGIGE